MKIALVAFQGEMMCFAHVLLNALDLAARGNEIAIIIEGAACKLLPELKRTEALFAQQYQEVCQKRLITAVCKACASKMGTLAEAEAQRLPLNGDMSGHPPLADYLAAGYQIITF